MLIFKGRNRVTQPYGGQHGGIDIVGDDDRQVRSVSAGTVEQISRWDGVSRTGTQSYGNLVIARDKAGKLQYYAHLAGISVREGQALLPGDVLGRVPAHRKSQRRIHIREKRLGQGKGRLVLVRGRGTGAFCLAEGKRLVVLSGGGRKDAERISDHRRQAVCFLRQHEMRRAEWGVDRDRSGRSDRPQHISQLRDTSSLLGRW